MKYMTCGRAVGVGGSSHPPVVQVTLFDGNTYLVTPSDTY